MEHRRESSVDIRAVVSFVLVAVLAGANGVAIRYSNRELAPFWSASSRFLLASAILLVIGRARGVGLPTGRALVGAVLFGSLNIAGFFAFVYWGLLRVHAGAAALVLSTVPLVTFLLAWLHGIESFHTRRVLGAAVAISGIALIYGAPAADAIPLASFVALVAAVLCVSEAFVVLKAFPRTDPLSTNTVGMAVGGLILLLLSLIFGETRALPRLGSSWIALVYLITFGTLVVFVAQIVVIKRWSASAASNVFVVMPLVTVGLSALLDGEAITWPLAGGGVLILVGVYVGALMRSGSESEDVAA